MNIYYWFNYFLHALIRLIHIQLFLTCISLPLLTWWGLPISLATIVGNILFAPCLSGFLLICSLIFFTELVQVPNSFLYAGLNFFTDCWLWLLSWSNPSWLISLPKPPIWFCIVIPLAAVLIEYKQRSHYLQFAFQASLLISSSLFLAFFTVPKTIMFTLKTGKKDISCIRVSDKTYIIDTGATATVVNAKAWCEHTLLCELRKHCGSTTIDGYIIIKPSIRTFIAAKEVASQTIVKKIFIPYWHNQTPSSIGKAFMNLKNICFEQEVAIVRIGKKPITVYSNRENHITIDPQTHMLKTTSLHYQQINCLVTLNKETTHIPCSKGQRSS